jgi:hypothetical protein
MADDGDVSDLARLQSRHAREHSSIGVTAIVSAFGSDPEGV